jgi:hypothetical protein
MTPCADSAGQIYALLAVFLQICMRLFSPLRKYMNDLLPKNQR